jgi:Protein of unknown function (DUF732)
VTAPIPPASTVTVVAPPPPPSTVTVQAAAPPPADPDVVPPPAAADPRDADFLRRVNATGEVLITNPALAVAGARTACTELVRGATQAQVVAEIQRHMTPPLTPSGAHDYLVAVVETYCPAEAN